MSGSSPHSVRDLQHKIELALAATQDIEAVHALDSLVEQLEARDRWAGFTHRETQDMHHALRMFAKYPGLSDEEAVGYTALADEIWDRHAAQTAAAYPGSRPS